MGISFQTPMAQHTRRIQLFSLLPRFRASSSSTLPLFLLTCICRFLLLFQRSEGVVHLRIRRTLGFCFWLSFSLWLACYSGRLSWDSIFSPAISGFRCRLRCRCCGSPYSVGHLRRAMPNYQRYSRRICTKLNFFEAFRCTFCSPVRQFFSACSDFSEYHPVTGGGSTARA